MIKTIKNTIMSKTMKVQLFKGSLRPKGNTYQGLHVVKEK